MRVPLFRWQHRLHWWTGADDDFLGILLTVLLLGATAFFVRSEFALISARRDRLEALAEQGKRSAVTVIRAGENLSLMLAGAQLGITVYSILLGRIGEPAVAHLLEKPFHVAGIPETLLHTVSFAIAITFVESLFVPERDGIQYQKHRKCVCEGLIRSVTGWRTRMGPVGARDEAMAPDGERIRKQVAVLQESLG